MLGDSEKIASLLKYMKLGWNFHALHMRGRSRGIVVGKKIIDEVSKYLGEGRSTNGRCFF